MSDISEHPQFGDLKRLLRKLEKADAKPNDPLSSLVREPARLQAQPPLPGSADVLPLPIGAKALDLPVGGVPATRRTSTARRRVLWVALPVAIAGVAVAIAWTGRPFGQAAWLQPTTRPQESPVQLSNAATSSQKPVPDVNWAPPPKLSSTSSAVPKDNNGPPPAPPGESHSSNSSSHADVPQAQPHGGEPPLPPAEPTNRVAEVNEDAPLLGGRDKYELEARLDAYMEHGQKLLNDGDVTGARSFFSRVADSGDPRGAMAMGATYDPNYIGSFKLRGVQPDLDAAGNWYRRAMDLGSKDALDRLDRLGDRPK